MRHFSFVPSALLVGSLLFASSLGSTASAQSILYWDSNTTGAGRGGSGTWNNFSNNWDFLGLGAYHAWAAFSPNGVAVFAGTAGTVTLSVDVTAQSLLFTTPGYTIAGPGALTLEGGISTDSGSQTISTGIAGTNGLTKTGNGTLLLTGGNTYTGNTTVKNGTLTLGVGGSINHRFDDMYIGNSDGDSGTFQLTGGSIWSDQTRIGNAASSQGSVTVSSGDWKNDGTLVVGNDGEGRLTISGGLVTAYGGTITGSGAGSAGIITLSGTSGNRGTLKTTRISEGSGNGGVTFDGGILQARVDESDFISGYESGDVTINAGGAFIDSNGHTIGISSPLTGTGGLTKQGAGTLTLSGANTYSGGTSVDEGRLTLGSGGSISHSAANTTVGSAGVDSGILDLEGGSSMTTNSLLVGTSGRGYVWVFGGLLSVEGATTIAPDAGVAGTIRLYGGTLSTNQIVEGNGTGDMRFDGGILQARTDESDFISGFESGDLNINNGGATIDSNGHTIGISSPLTGTGGLTKQGAGTLTLSGANTYSGGTTVEAGTLSLGASGTLASNTAFTLNGGTLDLNDFDLTASSLSGTYGSVDLGTANLTIDQSADTEYLGQISGTGGLTKTGAGVLWLRGNNTYTGGTTLSGGYIKLQGGNSNLPENGALTISGGTLWLSGGRSYTVGDVTLSSGTITGIFGDLRASSYAFTNDGTVSIFTKLQGSGALTKTGTGTLNLTGTNSYTGGTVVNSGTLTLGSGGSISHPAATTTVGNANGDVGTLRLNTGSSLNTNHLLIGNSGTGSLFVNGGTVTSASAVLGFTGTTGIGSVTVSSGSWTNASNLLIGRAGSGSLTVDGSGLVTVEGITYSGFYGGSTGAITLSGTSGNRGTLSTNRIEERVGGGPSTVTFDGGILQARVDESYFIANYESGDVTIDAGGAFIDSNGHAIGFTSSLGGTGGLTKLGAGTLTLNGTHTYTGGTTVEAGTLLLGASGTIASNTAHTINGGTLDLNNFDLTASSLSGTGGSVDLGTAKLTIDQSADTAYAGVISGTGGSLTKLGAGTLALSATNTYTGGTTVNGGLIHFANGDNFSTGTITLDGGGLQWAAGNTLDISNRLNPLGAAGGTFDTNGNLVTLATALTGAGGLTKQGAGTLTLPSTNTYTGGTAVNGGLIHFARGDNLGTGAITLDGGGLKWAAGNTLDISNRLNPLGAAGGTFDTNGNNLALATAMSGSGGLTKQGTGTLTLPTANAYTGTTTVNGGFINFAHVDSLGSGAITLDGGGLQWAAGNTLDISTRLNPIGAAGGTFDLNDNDVTFASAMSGSGGLTKQGTGILTLSGTNSYTGGTLISAGTLSLNHPTDTLADTGAVTLTGSTLALGTHSDTVGAVSLSSGSITGSGGTLTASSYNFTNSGSVTANLAGSGTLTKTGSGTLTLSGTNSYTGGTNITTGTLIGTTSSLPGDINHNGIGSSLIFDQSTSGTYASDIIGPGYFRKQGTGTVTLSGSNNYNRYTAILGGTLRFADTNAFYNGAVHASTADKLKVYGGGTASFGVGDGDYFSSSDIDALLTHAYWSPGSTIGFDTTNATGSTFTYASVISDAITGGYRFGLQKTGPGNLTLSNSNTYTDGTLISAGTLTLGHATDTLADTGTVTISGGTLDLGSHSDTVGAVTLSSGTIFSDSDNGTLTGSSYAFTDTGSASANLAGSGALTKTGSGTVTLSGFNTYSGGTTVSGGLINFANGDNLGTGAITLSGGGLQWATGNTLDISNRLDPLGAAGGTFDTNSNNITLATAMSGTGGLTKQGAGTLTLSGTNTYSGGTTVSAGTLQGNSTSLQGNILNNAALHFDQASNGIYAGVMSGTGTLNKTGAGTLTLSGSNQHRGVTTISAGTLALGHATDTLADFFGNVAISGGTLDLGANSDRVGDVSMSSGSITGTGTLDAGRYTFTDSGSVSANLAGQNHGLTKTGAGTVTLSGTNTYTGGTIVSAGTLAVTGTGSIADSLNAVFVGQSNGDTGTLEIANEGSVSSYQGVLGAGAGSMGAADISGTWTNSDLLHVGESGTGSLTVQAGGTVSNTSGTLARLSGSSGSADVSGTWTNSSSLIVGHSGPGDLTIQAGGSVSNTTGLLGLDSASSGSADVSGSWTNSSSLTVGYQGIGTLTVQDGGAVSNTWVSIGEFSGSSGSVDVAGTWTNSGDIYVGYRGVGALTIQAGGIVSNNIRANIGEFSSGTGSVDVSGTWNNSSEISIGKSGNGSLTIRDGGTASNTSAIIGESSGSSGTADISGTWTNSSSLMVGNAGTGTLTIQTGGTVSNTSAIIGESSGSSGTADVSGTWTNSDSLIVGNRGTGDLTIQDGGTVSSRWASIGETAGVTGSVDVSGTWANLIEIYVGYKGDGALTIRDGGTVSNQRIYIGHSSGSTGSADVSGAWNSSDKLFVGLGGSGTLTVQDGGAVNVKSGNDITTLANASGSTGTLNITGSTAAGILNTASVHGGAGTATLNFNHTDSDYHFTTDGEATGTAVAITGSTAVNHLGNGTTTLSGTNAYTGATTVSAGTLQFTQTTALYNDTPASWTHSNLIIAPGATLAVNVGGTGEFTSPNLDTLKALGDGSGGFQAGSFLGIDTTNASGGNFAYNSSITDTNSGADALGLVKLGTATLTLSGTNTYSGGTTVSAGTLLQGANAAFSPNTAYTVNGGTLDLNDFNLTASSLSGTGGSVDLGTADLTVDQSSNTTYSGAIIGSSGSVTKQGAGTLTLSGNNTYSGGTIVSAGTLAVTGTGSIADLLNAFWVGQSNGDAGTLEIANGGSVSSFQGILGGGSGSMGTADISGTWTNSDLLHVGESGTGSLTVRAGGTVFNTDGVLGHQSGSSGTADISGTWDNSGDLLVGRSGTGTLTVQNGGSVNVNSGTGITTLANASGSAGSLNITGSTAAGILNTASVNGGAGTATLNFNHTDSDYHFTTDGEATGTAVAITGSTSVNHLGTGITTLSGTNAYTGGTTVSAGTLRGTTSSLSGDIINNAALVIEQSTNGTYAGAMSGTGSFAKSGTGTTALSGTNTYTGATTVSAGTLQFAQTTALYNDTPANWTNSNLTIAPGATLAVNVGGTGEFTSTNLDTLKALGSASGGFQAGSFLGIDTTNASGGNFAYNSNITDTNSGAHALGLTKLGAGTLTLSGTNTYTGGTTISAGTLAVATDSNLGGTGSLSFSGGKLQTTATFSSGRDVVLNTGGGTFDVDDNTTLTMNGNLSGAAGNHLTKSGAGTLSLSGTNTYSGGNTVNGGLISFANGDNLGTGAITLSGGGLQWATGNTLDISNRLNAGGLAGASFDTNDNNITFATATSGTGDLTILGDEGTLTLTGSNTYSGNTVVSGRDGTLKINAGSTLANSRGHIGFSPGGEGSVEVAGTWINSDGILVGHFNHDGFQGTTGNLVIQNGGAVYSTSSRIASGVLSEGRAEVTGTWTNSEDLSVGHAGEGSLTIHPSGTVSSRSGKIGHDQAGIGSVEVWGTWTVSDILDIGHSGQGSLTIEEHGLVNAAAVLLGQDSVIVDPSGTITISGFNKPGVLNTASVHGGPGTATLNFDHFNPNSDYHFTTDGEATGTAVAITGSTAVNHLGGGTTTLSGTNNYTGGTTVSAGTLRGTTSSLPGNIINNASLVFDQSTNGTYTGAISGTGSFAKSGTGTTALSGANTYTGATTVSTGTLQFTQTTALYNDTPASWTHSNLTIAPGATLAVNVGGTGEFTSPNLDTLKALGSASGGFQAGSFLGIDTTNASGGNFAYNSNITDTNGGTHALGLTKLGTGTLVLGGTNAYSGDTRVEAGTLKIGAAGALSPNTHLRVHPGAIFDPNGFATSLGRLEGDGNLNLGSGDLSLNQAGDSTFAGIIGGTGGLAKSGAGRLTLTGTHTFSGDTDVSAGELRLNGTAPNSAFNVTGGRLSGSGTLGNLTLGNGGILAPGNSPGTLNASDTTWEGGATFEWEVNNAAGIVSTNWDLLNITGGLTITATDANPFTVNLVSLTAANAAGQVPNFDANADNSWTFVTTTTGITFGDGASIGASFAISTTGFQNTTNGTFGLAHSGNNLNVTYTTSAVPEPASFALLFGLFAIGCAATRRRRS